MAQGFAAALDNEAAWLATTPRTDGLPDLTTVFGTIQARFPRTPTKKSKQLYVLHDPNAGTFVERTTNLRAMYTHRLQLRMVWPITSAAAEVDQKAFEQAIDKVLTVVLGLPFDHTHGGRFLSAAEDPHRIDVRLQDPEYSLTQAPADRQYTATISYTVDDPEISN